MRIKKAFKKIEARLAALEEQVSPKVCKKSSTGKHKWIKARSDFPSQGILIGKTDVCEYCYLKLDETIDKSESTTDTPKPVTFYCDKCGGYHHKMGKCKPNQDVSDTKEECKCTCYSCKSNNHWQCETHNEECKHKRLEEDDARKWCLDCTKVWSKPATPQNEVEKSTSEVQSDPFAKPSENDKWQQELKKLINDSLYCNWDDLSEARCSLDELVRETEQLLKERE